nr:hypothetical protein [Tanacetum cinerariifolium]
MAFVSSPSSTNEVNTAYGVSTANTQANPTSTQVNTTSNQVSAANSSDATVYAFLASQPNMSQLVHEDLVQIHEDDLEEMDLKWQLPLLSMRTRSSRRTINVEDTSSNAMVAIDGAGFIWSFIANDEVPTNMALMAFLDFENEVLFYEQIDVLKRDISYKDSEISVLKRSQIHDNSKKGLGYESYHAVPPPPTRLFSPRKLDLSYSGLEDFKQPEFESYGPKSYKTESKNASEDIPNKLKEYHDAPLIKDMVSDNKDCLVESPVVVRKKTVVPTIAKVEFVRPKQQEKLGLPQKVQKDQGYVDSGCFRHMIGNMSYLSDFKEFNGGYFTFGGRANGGRITSKGTIKTSNLILKMCTLSRS